MGEGAASAPSTAPPRPDAPVVPSVPTGKQKRKDRQTSGDGAAPTGRYAVMSVKAYIGHSLLFSIPVVGWAICLMMAFAAKSLNKRNYARAMLVFLLIGIILAVIARFVAGWISEEIQRYIVEATGGAAGDLSEMKGLFDLLQQFGG